MVAVKEAPKTRNAEVEAPKEMAPEMKERKGLPTPFTLMGRFAEEMERLFEEFGLEPMGFMPRLLGRGREPMGRGTTEAAPKEWTPRVEMFEREGQLVVHADLPGLTPEDVKVEVTPEHLTLQGERKEEKKEEREGYYHGECRYGAFYRAIPLPEGVDTTHATAAFRKGVLEVLMPKATPARTEARRLEVREAN